MSEQPTLDLDIHDAMADVRAKASKFVFRLGVEMIMAQGVKETSARSFLGKRLKEIGKPTLLRGIINAAFSEVTDPRAYLAAIKKPAGANPSYMPQQDEDNSAGIQSWMK